MSKIWLLGNTYHALGYNPHREWYLHPNYEVVPPVVIVAAFLLFIFWGKIKIFMTSRSVFSLAPIALLLIAYADPDDLFDGYFMMLRVGVCAYFAWVAWDFYERKTEGISWQVLGGVAALYNPFLPVGLGRELWLIVNTLTIGVVVYVAIRQAMGRRSKERAEPE